MDEIVFDMAAARRKFNAAVDKTKFDNTKLARKKREVDLAQVIDRRSLRATGRTEQFNFRVRADLKLEIKAAADTAGLGVAEWLERAAEAMLANGDADTHA